MSGPTGPANHRVDRITSQAGVPNCGPAVNRQPGYRWGGLPSMSLGSICQKFHKYWPYLYKGIKFTIKNHHTSSDLFKNTKNASKNLIYIPGY